MANDDNLEKHPYGIDEDEMKQRASELLMKNKQYSRLFDEYQRCSPRDFVKRNLLQTKMRLMESAELDRLITLEIERRKNVEALAALLKEKDTDEWLQYMQYIDGLSLMIDMMDSTFSDINILLRRNHMGVTMGQFPELIAARKRVMGLANAEPDKMPKAQADLWAEESERIYAYLQQRMAVYRRKVNRVLD